MKSAINLIFLMFLLNSYGQDTLFYDGDWNAVKSFEKCEYYAIYLKNTSDSNRVTEKSYFKSGQLKKEAQYSDYAKKTMEGVVKSWYNNGVLKSEINYTSGFYNGSLKTFWDNGKLRRDDIYEKGKLVEGKVYNSDGKEALYYDYEIMPQYPGGTNELVRYLSTKVKYPKKSRKAGIEGKVILKFFVETDGSIGEISVEKSVSEELDEEAIRVVKKMPNWESGVQDGTKIRVYFRLPINFRLN